MLRWLALSFALAAFACSTPIDPNGAAQCGANNSCPSGFACRWTSCCPTGSDAGMCPSTAHVTRDPTGAMYPPLADGTCPVTYENRHGTCCPVDSSAECPPHLVGSHCTLDSDCTVPGGLAPICITNQSVHEVHQSYTDGYCSGLNCDPNVPNVCGAGGVCVPNPGSSVGTCYRGCALPTGALAGSCPNTAGSLICVSLRDAFNPTAGVCIPDCSHGASLDGGSQCEPGWVCEEPIPTVHVCHRHCTVVADCPTNYTCDLSAGTPGLCRPPMP